MPKYRFTEIAINSTEKKKPTEADKETYIGLEHLDSGTLTVSRWGSEVAPIGEKLLMKKGDVLFGKRRAYQKKVGIAPFDGIFSAHGMVLRPREEVITKEYFPLFISSDYFLNEAIRISVGSLSPTVNWKDLKDLTFNIPTIEEQRRITPLVWAAIKAKNAYKSLIQRTDDLVKSQFIEMFGTIDCEGVLPRVQWKNVLSIINGKDYKAVWQEDGEYPVYGSGGIMARASEYLCPENTVLMGRKGTIDNPLLIREKFWNVDTAFGVVPDPDKLDCVYLHWYCKQLDFTKLNKATTLPSTTKADLLNLWINVPEMSQQLEFAEFVEQSDKSKFVVSNRNLSSCLVMKQNRCASMNYASILVMETGLNQRINQRKAFA
jgi:type I restriction enzyme S subunit